MYFEDTDLCHRLINNGKRVIPTIDIDGQIYSNPGINKVMKIIEK